MTDPTRKPMPTERLLLRLLTDPRGEGGDLSPVEARELRRRLEEEPELAARFERLGAPWRKLEPPPASLPPGFAGRVMTRLEEERRQAPPLFTAPVGVRSLATLALVLGVGVGLAVGPLLVRRVSDASPRLAPVEIAETLGADWLEDVPDLAASYFQALETETDGAAGTDPGAPENGSPRSTSEDSPDPGGNP